MKIGFVSNNFYIAKVHVMTVFMEMALQPPLSCGQTKRQPFCVPQSVSSNFQARLFLEAWLSTKDQNAGNDHIAIPEVYKPLARL